jgi:thiol-disulfide isomerase/thioredoxin
MHKLFLSALLACAIPFYTARAEDITDKPLDLKFTAVDGKTVDLSQMRGKVVLIDFWATWCAPCRAEIPDVVATYKKFHDRGFEVVGISLDQDKDTMVNFTGQHGMTWPQYFDGKGWDNAISSGFGIREIPTMVLLGKDGKPIRSSGDDLDEAVEKAINEPVK